MNTWRSAFTRATISLAALAAFSWSHPADPSPSAAKYTIYGKDGVTLDHQSSTADGGWVGSGPASTLQLNTHIIINGEVHTIGHLDVDGWGTAGGAGSSDLTEDVYVNGNVVCGVATFDKNLQYGGSYTVGVSTVAGTTTNSNPNVSTPSWPSSNYFPDGSHDVTSAANCNASGGAWGCTGGVKLPAGTYGNSEIDGTVELGSGEYYFNSLMLRSGARLNINKTSSEVTRIIIKEKFEMIAGTSVQTMQPDDYGKVLIYVDGTNVTINSATQIDATIYTPFEDLYLNFNVAINGQTIAKSISTANSFNGNNGSFVPFDPSGVSIVGAATFVFKEDNDGIVPESNDSHLEKIAVGIDKADTAAIDVNWVVRAIDHATDSAATLGADFSNSSNGAAASGTVTIPAGSTLASDSIPVWIVDDAEYEQVARAYEFIEVVISLPVGSKAVLQGDGAAWDRIDVNGDGKIDSLVYRLPIEDDELPNQAPSGRDTTFTVAEDSVLNATLIFTDANGDTYSVFLNDSSDNGALSLGSTGAFTYTPNTDFNGTDIFMVQATDGVDTSGVMRVTITVEPRNDAPVGVDDAYSTNEGVTLNVAASGVLTNDTDIDAGDTKTAVSITETDAPNGTVTLNANGSFSYVPDADFFGRDSFYYAVEDAGGLRDTAKVIITVNPLNDDPTPENDTLSTDEDVTLVISLATLTSNDSDPEGDALTVISIGSPQNGSFDWSTKTYTPNSNYNGKDSLLYTVSDGNGGTATAWIHITVNPVDDAPVANDDSYSGDENTLLTVTAPGVLSNDTDVEGDVMTVALVTDAANGTLVLSADGSFTFDPDTDWASTTYFEYEVIANGLRDTARVNISIRDDGYVSPTFNDQDFTIAEDAAIGTSLGSLVITGGAGQPWSFVVVGGGKDFFDFATDGEITLASGADLDYETDSVYTLDVTVEGVSATVTIHVTNVVELPTFGTQGSFSVTENVKGDQAGVVSMNASDGEPQATFSIKSGDSPWVDYFEIDPASGALSLKADSSLDYESVTSVDLVLTATNSDGSSDLSVTVTVDDVNEPHSLVESTLSVNEDAAINDVVGMLSVNDEDATGSYTYTLLTVAPFTLTGNTLKVSNTLDYETQASYSLQVQVSDGTHTTTGTITVNVGDVVEAPNGIGGPFSVAENQVGVYVGRLDVSNPDGIPAWTFSNPSDARFTVTSGGFLYLESSTSLDYEAEPGHQVSLTVDVANDEGSDTFTVLVNIVNRAEIPSLNDTTLTVREDVSGASGQFFVGSDPDGSSNISAYYLLGYGGPFTVATTGELQVSGLLDYETQTSYSIQVVVEDATGYKDTADVTINIENVVEAPILTAGTYYVLENDPGAELGDLVVANVSDVSAATWTIVAGDPGGLFQIVDGVLSLKADSALDYESSSTHDLTIRVVNGAEGQDEEMITVQVLDVNEEPTLADRTINVQENANTGSILGTLVASDPENNVNTYYIIEDDTPFSINNSGVITLDDPLDYETTSSNASLLHRFRRPEDGRLDLPDSHPPYAPSSGLETMLGSVGTLSWDASCARNTGDAPFFQTLCESLTFRAKEGLHCQKAFS
jgi:VCBS repeat-containing protein